LAISEFEFADTGLKKILARHMDALKRGRYCEDLYDLIDTGLKLYARHGQINGSCIAYVHDRLSVFAKDPLNFPNARIKARLLQQHLSLYLPRLEPRDSRAPPEAPEEIIIKSTPSEYSPSLDSAVTPPPSRTDVNKFSITEADSSVTTSSQTSASTEYLVVNDVALEGVVERVEGRGQAPSQRERVDTMLRSEQDAWQAIYGTVKDYSKLKKLWQKKVKELEQERTALTQKLDDVTVYLKKVETERQALLAEMDKLRKRRPKKIGAKTRVKSAAKGVSRASKKRPAPSKRDDFVHQLEAEVERVKRSGGPLALALIELQNLDAINQHYGHEAWEAVLHCYADEILASFRAYDLVARYDKDEFVVLFPNTHKEGAVRALEKAQKRAGETHFNHAGRNLPLPGFSSVLACYAAGEESTNLLKRADQALDDARNKGRDQVVVA
jgi:diguanylate cyclase